MGRIFIEQGRHPCSLKWLLRLFGKIPIQNRPVPVWGWFSRSNNNIMLNCFTTTCTNDAFVIKKTIQCVGDDDWDVWVEKELHICEYLKEYLNAKPLPLLSIH